MNSSFDIYPLFSTPLYKSFIQYDLENILDQVKKFEYISYASKNGYRTVDTKILDQKIFSNLKVEIERHLETYVFDFLKVSREIELKHTCSWINLHKKFDYSQHHCHNNSMFSGILYLDVDPEKCGNIGFNNPEQIPTWKTPSIAVKISESNLFNSNFFYFQPKNGLILIFPSHLNHFTDKNIGEDNRYSIAFNYFLNGHIDISTADINLKVL